MLYFWIIGQWSETFLKGAYWDVPLQNSHHSLKIKIRSILIDASPLGRYQVNLWSRRDKSITSIWEIKLENSRQSALLEKDETALTHTLSVEEQVELKSLIPHQRAPPKITFLKERTGHIALLSTIEHLE